MRSVVRAQEINTTMASLLVEHATDRPAHILLRGNGFCSFAIVSVFAVAVRYLLGKLAVRFRWKIRPLKMSTSRGCCWRWLRFLEGGKSRNLSPQNEGEPALILSLLLQASQATAAQLRHHALPLVRPALPPHDGVHRCTIGCGHTIASHTLSYLFPVRAFTLLSGMDPSRAAG